MQDTLWQTPPKNGPCAAQSEETLLLAGDRGLRERESSML
jgi:hypothetical protein